MCQTWFMLACQPANTFGCTMAMLGCNMPCVGGSIPDVDGRGMPGKGMRKNLKDAAGAHGSKWVLTVAAGLPANNAETKQNNTTCLSTKQDLNKTKPHMKRGRLTEHNIKRR